MEQLSSWLSRYNDEIVVGLVILVLGAPLLWLLARPLAWWNRRSERQRMRLLLQSEIGDNLGRLDALWAELNRPWEHLEADAADGILGAVRLVRRDPPPRWERVMWDDASRRIGADLNDTEREAVSIFYRRLAQFDDLRGRLGTPIRTLETRRDPAGAFNLPPNGKATWAKIGELVEAILVDGNPLATHEHSESASTRDAKLVS